MAERLLLASGLPARLAHLRRGERLILAYHNIMPDGAEPVGDRSLHLPLARFEEQLEILAVTCDILPLADLLSASGPRADRPVLALTFDDAYLGAVQWGVGALQRRGLPATIFVAPAFLGGASFWWDAIAAPGGGGLSDAHRGAALQQCRGRDPEVRAWARSAGLPLHDLPDWMRCADESQLTGLVRNSGITLGSHSWSHPNLTRLTPAELAEELSRPRSWMAERGLGEPPVISYPYGLSDARVRAAAGAAGYRWGLSVSGGWMSAECAPLAVPRLNIPAGLTPEGFRLRLAGLWAG